jgi:hypothetical protein
LETGVCLLLAVSCPSSHHKAQQQLPISAGHGWPLYGNEYGRMKFGNCQLLPLKIY